MGAPLMLDSVLEAQVHVGGCTTQDSGKQLLVLIANNLDGGDGFSQYTIYMKKDNPFLLFCYLCTFFFVIVFCVLFTSVSEVYTCSLFVYNPLISLLPFVNTHNVIHILV